MMRFDAPGVAKDDIGNVITRTKQAEKEKDDPGQITIDNASLDHSQGCAHAM
jgi:hypothetical protein